MLPIRVKSLKPPSNKSNLCSGPIGGRLASAESSEKGEGGREELIEVKKLANTTPKAHRSSERALYALEPKSSSGAR